jgi:hypothetical protein
LWIRMAPAMHLSVDFWLGMSCIERLMRFACVEL